MASVVSGVLRVLSESYSKVFSNFFSRHPLIVTRKASAAETSAKAPEVSNAKWLVRTKHDNEFQGQVWHLFGGKNEESQNSGSYSRTKVADRQRKGFSYSESNDFRQNCFQYLMQSYQSTSSSVPIDDVLSVKSYGENRQHQMQFKDFGRGSYLIRVSRSLCTHDGIEAALKWKTRISTDGVVRLHPETQLGHLVSDANCNWCVKGKGFFPKTTST